MMILSHSSRDARWPIFLLSVVALASGCDRAGTQKPQLTAPASVGKSTRKTASAPAPPSNSPQSAMRPSAAFSRVVCIDPGHPSETSSGAEAHGLSENRLNWQVAVALRERLRERGVRSVLTKQSENQHVTNRQRAETANRAKAALFIRLHCDEGSGHGFTWYYPDRSGRKQGVTGPPQSVQHASREAAKILNDTMKPILAGSLASNPIKTDASTFVGGKQGGVLTGSIFARVPTALIEMCFINQKSDAQFIASASGRDRMAEALTAGIMAYLEKTQRREQ
jgi:N-acetylmuramoyl-L-alanine amidase